VAKALRTTGKADEAAAIQRELDALEPLAHSEYEKTALSFSPQKYVRKKGSRVVLVELFTGAQCPPCVGADMGFDALERAFGHKDVILLQYHLHIPRPDALTTPDSEAREDFYGDDVRGTPSIFFNGKAAAGGGGGKGAAEAKYTAYRAVIEPILEEDAALKLAATAVRKGDKIEISAAVDSKKKLGEKVKLRLVLVEDWVRYLGSNGLPYHHRVVRALPGGAGGLAIKDNVKQSVTYDLEGLKKSLSKFLDRAGLDDPTPYRNLTLVAFVQDDATREVLHAIEVAGAARVTTKDPFTFRAGGAKRKRVAEVHGLIRMIHRRERRERGENTSKSFGKTKAKQSVGRTCQAVAFLTPFGKIFSVFLRVLCALCGESFELIIPLLVFLAVRICPRRYVNAMSSCRSMNSGRGSALRSGRWMIS